MEVAAMYAAVSKWKKKRKDLQLNHVQDMNRDLPRSAGHNDALR
jgi:hypothetical protein